MKNILFNLPLGGTIVHLQIENVKVTRKPMNCICFMKYFLKIKHWEFSTTNCTAHNSSRYFLSRDPKITHLLLQAQYPVLGVDCYMPVIDVFSGSCKGNLRVVLAMGRSEQIISLQRTRDEEYDSLSHLVRPVHLLDHQPSSHTKVRIQCVHYD